MATALAQLGEHRLLKDLPERLALGVDKCLNLVCSNGDMLFLWNNQSYCVEGLRLRTTLRDRDYQTLYCLAPDPPLLFNVERLLLNRSGTLLALWAPSGLAVLHLPTRYSKETVLDLPCVNLSQKDFLMSDHVVRQVRWSLDQSLDCYLLALTSDQCLRVYHALTGSTLASYPLSYHMVNRTLPSLAALGELPVDFFPLHSEKENTCPLLILWGTGEVYMLEAKLKGEEGRKSGLVGPLRMFPEAEDNYGGDACSLLVLDTKPPVVAMATSNGTIYHSLLMSNHSTARESSKDPGKALFVVESVQLEIGFSLGALEDDDDFISCPVRLEPDPIEKSRYLGVHNGGIHCVRLPLVKKLEEFCQKVERDGEGEEFIPYKIDSLAEYVVCTWLVGEGDARACSPLLGIAHLDLETYLVLLSDWSPLLLEVAPPPLPSASAPHPSSPSPSSVPNNILLTVNHLLSAASKPPLLKLPDHQGTNPRQWLEITLNLIQRYRNEVFKRYEKCGGLLEKQAELVRVGCANQRRTIDQLNTEKKLLQDNAHAIAVRYEEIQENQNQLIGRTEQLLLKMRAHSGMLNKVEKKHTVRMTNFSTRIKQLEYAIKMIQSTAAVQSAEKDSDLGKEKSIFLNEKKTKFIRTHLSKLNTEISDLTKKIKQLQLILDSAT